MIAPPLASPKARGRCPLVLPRSICETMKFSLPLPFFKEVPRSPGLDPGPPAATGIPRPQAILGPDRKLPGVGQADAGGRVGDGMGHRSLYRAEGEPVATSHAGRAMQRNTRRTVALRFDQRLALYPPPKLRPRRVHQTAPKVQVSDPQDHPHSGAGACSTHRNRRENRRQNTGTAPAAATNISGVFEHSFVPNFGTVLRGVVPRACLLMILLFQDREAITRAGPGWNSAADLTSR